MRLILQPMAGGFELCARLGLVLAPATNLTRVIRLGMAGQIEATAPLQGLEDGKLVHAVLDGSASARAGIQSRDIIFAINGRPGVTFGS
jgi:S1-C subfamily serine protease